MQKKTWLPVFSGFYETIWKFEDVCGDIEYTLWNRPDLVPKDIMQDICNEVWCNINYGEYEDAIVKEFIDALNGELPTGMVMEYDQVIHPREYNFHNDSVNINITYTKDAIAEIQSYIRGHAVAFGKYIERKYTSCSGFWSFYSNDVSVWLDVVDTLDDPTKDYEHEFGSILNFYLLHKCDVDGSLEFDMYEHVRSNVYAGEYINHNGLIQYFNAKYRTDIMEANVGLEFDDMSPVYPMIEDLSQLENITHDVAYLQQYDEDYQAKQQILREQSHMEPMFA